MLVSMSDKELKRLSVLQEICDQRITQSQAAQLLHISERQIRRLLQKYKAQGPVALAHAGRGQISNSKLPEELRLKCLNIVSDQLHGFGPTLAHEKLTTVHGFDLSVETLRSWMIAAAIISMTLSLKSFEYPMLLLFYIFEYLAIVNCKNNTHF